MKIPDSIKRYGLTKVYDYLDKDPMTNMSKVMDMVNKFAGDTLPDQRAAFDKVISDPDSCWYKLIEKVWTETDPDVLKTFFNNFMINANIVGWPHQEEMRAKYGCNIPWAILLDPTSACNLHCTGCWAAEYGNKLNLTFDEIDSIITQGKELGIYLYIYTGGEPLVRKKDLIALCEKHPDAAFLSFTNATLIDEAFCQDMLRVKNFVPAISLEGFEQANDSRRGQGVYQKVTDAMALLKSHRLPFGISTCYTSVNYKDITSEEFYDNIMEVTICRYYRSVVHLKSSDISSSYVIVLTGLAILDFNVCMFLDETESCPQLSISCSQAKLQEGGLDCIQLSCGLWGRGGSML